MTANTKQPAANFIMVCEIFMLPSKSKTNGATKSTAKATMKSFKLMYAGGFAAKLKSSAA